MVDMEKGKVKNEKLEAFKGMIFILLLIVICVYSCSDKKEPAKQKEALYNVNVIYTISTEKGNGFDKTIDKFGIEGVKKINDLLPKAADLIAKSPECNELNIVSLSQKSTPENILIYGHCTNGARFNLSEKDINDKKPVLTDKQKMLDAVLDLMGYCDEVIKSQLNYPSTYDKSIWESDYTVYDDRVVIETVFTAKNAFNLELKYRAKCYFNDKKELTGFEMHEDR